MSIVFATNNKHQLDEVRRILGKERKVLSLADIECFDDIPETGRTLEENALMKAKYVYERYQCNVFADDTGLEVEALDGEPGTFSARYASINDPNAKSHDSEANMTTLLEVLEGKDNRKARFRTVIALVMKDFSDPAPVLFDGIVEGEIISERRGGEGFGYDPIFQPTGYDKTFAELGNDIKNTISHRARAVKKLGEYLDKVDEVFY